MKKFLSLILTAIILITSCSVFAEDVLTGKATVTNLVKRNPQNGLVEITIEAFNQKGELVLKDVTEAVVKCKPLEQ